MYSWVGKSALDDWSTIYTFFWKDFNPINNSDFRSMVHWDLRSSWETSYNLSWFQVWTEVCIATFEVKAQWLEGIDLTIDMYFQKYKSWWQNAWWVDTMYWTPWGSTSWYVFYYYVWVDDDEIWTDATQYRFFVEITWGGYTHDIFVPFTISNLSFDTSTHPSWYLWVQWLNLCYTDDYYWSGYKHIINYDSWYNWGSGTKWYIRLPNTSTDDHIYYVDAYWTVRRTWPSQKWYDDGDNYAWTSKKWYIRICPSFSMRDWGGHLCYVNSAWYKRRITNGWW